MPAVDLTKNLAAYDAQHDALQASYGDQWAVFFDGDFKGTYRSYNDAIAFALTTFGDAADFLIRRLVERSVTIPMLVVDR